MKKIALAFVAATAFAGQALAADVAVKARPPVAMVPSWTGFYVGINGGGAWSDGPSMTYVDLANIGNTTNAYAPSTINPSSSTSGIAGFHAGYNWQLAPTWVLGIEGDWDWTNISAGGTNRLNGATNLAGGTFGLLTDNVSMQTKVNWLASVRGRLGYASPTWMLYGTGGVAFADMDFNAQVHCTGPVRAPGASLCDAPGQDIRPTGFNDKRVGWVAGAGFEFKPTTNWIFGLEYLYYRFDGTNTGGGSWTFPNGQPAPFYACTVAGQNCARFSYDDVNVQTVRARLSYQFGGPGPVVAKY
jgi:outer membrane immunogenic protein